MYFSQLQVKIKVQEWLSSGKGGLLPACPRRYDAAPMCSQALSTTNDHISSRALTKTQGEKTGLQHQLGGNCPDFEQNTTWVQIPALPLNSYVNLDKILHFPVPRSCHL
ncbi:unnamed protein product [Rangifer tarandus platyrhynchus]|uniref:Uncharacterized protein n=2 Tax=Rangifer tarandus platyrhynchus TaxID=3082113 RepID=A0ABN8YI64_RANTA|nr:unnamed protein product [Rangifer tarandus platyrhynchus]